MGASRDGSINGKCQKNSKNSISIINMNNKHARNEQMKKTATQIMLSTIQRENWLK